MTMNKLEKAGLISILQNLLDRADHDAGATQATLDANRDQSKDWQANQERAICTDKGTAQGLRMAMREIQQIEVK